MNFKTLGHVITLYDFIYIYIYAFDINLLECNKFIKLPLTFTRPQLEPCDIVIPSMWTRLLLKFSSILTKSSALLEKFFVSLLEKFFVSLLEKFFVSLLVKFCSLLVKFLALLVKFFVLELHKH